MRNLETNRQEEITIAGDIKVRELSIEGYERVVEATQASSGLHTLIAIHNTELGPSLGGTRFYPYTSREEALTDVLRLARGMTYKSAVTETGLGGGKSVIVGDPKLEKSPELLRAFAAVVHHLEGTYICAEDMGTTPADMRTICEVTPYVTATGQEGSSGDPSPYTAWGVFRSMQAVAKKLWRSNSLEGRRIAIQGMGAVGSKLLDHLYWHGAELVISDVDPARAAALAETYGAELASPEEILSRQVDILAPCAVGGILNASTIPRLRCQAVAGAANNQLLEPEHGELLRKVGILYAPDFVVNAGGIMNVSVELDQEGYHPTSARNMVRSIYDLLMSVFIIAEKRCIATSAAADELAEHKLRYGIGKRRTGLKFDH